MSSLWKYACRLLFAGALFNVTCSAYAYVDGYAGLDLAVSNNAAKAGIYSLKEAPNSITNLGVTGFFNTQSDYTVDTFGSISRKGLAGSQNLELGLKGQLFYLQRGLNSQMGYGLKVGVLARYWLPTSVPSAIYADYLYAPDILVFGDARNAYEWAVRGELQMTSRIKAYAGIRQLKADFSTGMHEFDGNAQIGVNIAF